MYLRENPLLGQYAPDFSQISLNEYTEIRIHGLETREGEERKLIAKQEKESWSALWEPFSDVLEEERWRKRLQKRAELLSFEQQCERDKNGTEGLSLIEQKERLGIYRQWVTEYKQALPHQKAFRKTQLDHAIEAHLAIIGETAMDSWLRVIVLDHVNLQEALLREERRARALIEWEGLLAGGTSSPEIKQHSDSSVSKAQALFAEHNIQKDIILLESEDEPYQRQRITRLELQERLVATMPSSSPKAFWLAESLGREAIESTEAFERYRGAIMGALRQLQYDLWFAQLKAMGVPRRWRGEDIGNM